MSTCRFKGCKDPVTDERAEYSYYCSSEHAHNDPNYQEHPGARRQTSRRSTPDEYARGLSTRLAHQYGGDETMGDYKRVKEAIDYICRPSNHSGFYTTAPTISGRWAQIWDQISDEDSDEADQAERMLNHAYTKDSLRIDRKYRPRITLAAYINRMGGHR